MRIHFSADELITILIKKQAKDKVHNKALHTKACGYFESTVNAAIHL